MRNYKEHLIVAKAPLKQALLQLNDLAADAILFVVDENGTLIGSLTDGDVRRGLIEGYSIEDKITHFAQPHPKYIYKKEYNIQDIIALRDGKFGVIPVLDESDRVINIVNFRFLRSYLPIDAILMAGGRGSRLRPLTDNVPKPLLKIGEKPIIEHNLDRLAHFGVDDIWITLRYLGEQVADHLGDGQNKGINIQYIWEESPLGTLGAAGRIESLQSDYVLVSNSDILTTLDYEDFFLDFIDKGADMSVATVPYSVDIPYGVLETENHDVVSFREKPTYTYYSNGGIYLLKRELLDLIPKNTVYDTTDLMQQLLQQERKLVSYPIRQYWLDIGKPEDFEKAQEDIKHLELQ